MSNKLLQNKSFIQWRLFPSEEDDLYWRAFIKDHPEMKNEIDEATRVIKSIKLNTRKLTPEEKQDIFNLIRKDIEKRNRHKRNTVYIGISSSVACVALALLLLRVFVPVGEERVVLPESVDIMRDSVVNAKEIRLILGDEKAITIENESDILYNTQGEVVINTSEEKIKAGKAATENFVLNTLIVPKGRHLNLTLSDGTKVWVNSGTTLKFPVEFDPG
ncbi:MAG: hypothetical protein LBH77_01005, partial [Tannerella sp.]|nr:hypothetical protein [Tannerella sp.]